MGKLFTGIIPALYTCFNDDGSVNYSETGRLAEWLVDKGANGFYLCGTTGSGLLLEINERKKIVETISEAVNGKVPLMVHVGCMNTKDSQELASHAGKVKGVCAISSLPPQYYDLPIKDEIEHLSTIASVTDLPFYPYVFDPTINKYGINNIVDIFSQITNIAGIKAFVTDLSVHQAFCKKAPSQWQLLHGVDQCLCQALIIPGINGAIGSTYNVVPEIVTAIYSSVANSNYTEAISLHSHYGGYWLSLQGHNFLTFGRYFLQKRGFKMGRPRLPLRLPSEDEIAEVENKLVKAGFNFSTGGL
jgi:N-acetylneuraminate lyase